MLRYHQCDLLPWSQSYDRELQRTLNKNLQRYYLGSSQMRFEYKKGFFFFAKTV
jgi:hypothetical protein